MFSCLLLFLHHPLPSLDLASCLMEENLVRHHVQVKFAKSYSVSGVHHSKKNYSGYDRNEYD